MHGATIKKKRFFKLISKWLTNLTAHPPPCKRCHTTQTWLHILESVIINRRSFGIRNLPGICLMVAGVHYIRYAHVVYTFVQVNMMYRGKTLLNCKCLIYCGCVCVCLQISIAASYLMCITYFSVISRGHSLMYGASDENNNYIIETVSTLTPINSYSPTRISLLSAVNASLLAAMNSRGNLQQITWFIMEQTQIHKFIYTNTAAIYQEFS